MTRSEFQRLYECDDCGSVPLCRNEVVADPASGDDVWVCFACAEHRPWLSERELGESGA